VTFKGYIRCFPADTSHELVALTFNLLILTSVLYTVPLMPDAHTNFECRMIIGYWVLSFRALQRRLRHVIGESSVYPIEKATKFTTNA